MARKRISEYKAKSLLFQHVGIPYSGIETFSSSDTILQSIDPSKRYVVKVDQGIKKRFKLGLVKLNVSADALSQEIKTLEDKGFTRFIIEEYREYDATNERYISFEIDREGIIVFASQTGGINIEENEGAVRRFHLPYDSLNALSAFSGLEVSFLEAFISLMEQLHISFLEINPFVITDNSVLLLDLAVEVDSAGEFFVQEQWTAHDYVGESGGKTPQEQAVEALSAKSQASFKLNILNPNGSLFMLLSGGGASIVLADEVYNQGEGRELANYGEYSGNPNAEETYLYTKQILSLLLDSTAEKKVLIIAGGVANFTDIRVTFKGIIQALDEVKESLREQGVKVYVRRGGPYQDEGLAMMKKYLEKEQLLGVVSGPEMVLTDIVNKALEKRD